MIPAAGPLAGLEGNAPSLMTLGAVSVLLITGDVVARLIRRGVADGQDARTILRAVAARLALAPAAARATLDACLPATLSFTVTRKSLAAPGPGIIPRDHLVLFALAAAALPFALDDAGLGLVGLCALMLPLPAAVFTARDLARYRAALTALLPPLPA